MPKLGGSATITGVDFEAWFVALKFADAFFDDSKVKPQAQTFIDPKTQETEITEIDDIYVYSDSIQEFYNIKFRAPNIKSWTLNHLRQRGVLQQLKDQFIKSQEASLYFVTQSPCPIFAEILPRGASCMSREELEIKLKANNYIVEWDKLQKEMGFSDCQMFKFTKQIKYKHIIDIEETKNLIKEKFYGHVTNLDSLPNCLYQLAIEAGKGSSIITRGSILEYFAKNNIHLKPHLRLENLLEKIKTASANLSSVPYTFAGNVHIERDEVTTLVNWTKTPLKEKDSPIAVLTGKAGCGKTVIQRDLLIKFQEEKTPILGIKTDLLTFDSVETLSNELGISDGIKETMAAIVDEYGRGVILFDQLDALSFTMAKNRNAIKACYNLISQLSLIKGLRIIVSCRTFDLKYDSLLKSLEHKYTVNVNELDDQQVNRVLSELGVQRQQTSDTLFSLLGVPLHLEIFCKIYKQSIILASLNTLQDLYNELWNQKILEIPDDSLQKDVIKTIDTIVEKMDSAKTLTVPFAQLDRNSKGRNYLLSHSILYGQNNKLQFFHSSFFDYCYARTFLARHDSLLEIIIKQHQGLFIRPQVKQVLAYLRDSDFTTYLNDLKGFLTNPKVRFHIRLLVINQLAFLQDTTDEEWQIVKRLFENDDNFKKHFIDSIQSDKWLEYLILSGYLESFLQSGNTELINLIIWKLRTLINTCTKTVIDFLEQFPNIEKKNEHIGYILEGLDHWEDEGAIQLFQRYLPIIKCWDRFYFDHLLERILTFNSKVVFKVFFDDLNEKVNDIKSADGFDKKQFLDYHDIEIFKKLLDWNLELVVSKALQIIRKLIDKTKWKSKIKFYWDGAFYGYEQFEHHLYHHWQFLSLVIEKVKTVAIKDKPIFLKLVDGICESFSFTLLKIVLRGYNSKPNLYFDDGFKLLNKKEILENLMLGETSAYELRTLLKNIYPYFSKEQKKEINKLILSISPKWEQKREKGRASRVGYSKYKLLNTISDEELSVYPEMKEQLLQLKRKFGRLKLKPPQISQMETVGPPFPENAYEKMTFDQWFSSFQKYDDSTSWDMPNEDFDRGGIIEHSRAFEEQVSKKPDEFYTFVFNLGEREDISITYLAAGLNGLVKAKYDIKKVKQIVKAYWKNKDTEFRRRIVWAIDYIDSEDTLDLDLIAILADYALNDPDPTEELWKVDAGSGTPYYGGDPLTYGINTVRGSAAQRLVIHGNKTESQEKVFEILNKIAEDKSITVRCCLIKFLYGMLKWNREKVYNLLMKIMQDKHPQIIKYGLECIVYLMTKNNFQNFVPYIKRILQLKGDFVYHSVGKYIGRLLMLAYVREYPKSNALLEEGFKKNEEVIIGAIDFASGNLNNTETKIAEKSRKIYLRFLNEDSEKVGKEYDWCFNDFKVEDFNKIYDLLFKYSKSNAVKKQAEHFFKFLSKCVSYEPKKCIDLMQNYKWFEKPDIRYNILQGEPVQILIEAYNRVIDDEYKEKAMDIFDKILQEERYKRKGLEVLAEQDRE